MEYWIVWNAYVSLMSETQFQVEKRTGELMENLWKSIFPKESRKTDFSKCDDTDPHANTEHVKKHHATNWTYLSELNSNMATMAKILAKKFGYDVDVDMDSYFSCYVTEKKLFRCGLNELPIR